MSARAVVREFLASARFTSALASTGIGLAALSHPLPRLIGSIGYASMLIGLIVLMGLCLLARRDQVEWRGIPPISLLAFLAWCAASLFWSQYQWATLGGLVQLAAFTLIAGFIAVSRDMIQIVRAMGDVLRLVLGLSLGLEVFSGILIDSPIAFLGIRAHIAELGPITGLGSTRNQLGLLALLGGVTFAVELRTKSIRMLPGVLSLVLAGLCAALTRSPVVALAALVGLVGAAVLYAVRRVPADRRQVWQFVVLGVAIVAAAIAWVFRSALVELFNATGDLTYRLVLWDQARDLVPLHLLEGWGWIGRWQTALPPYAGLQTGTARQAASALNAYLDVVLQVGVVGVFLFVGMAGLAFTRSWLLAGRRRSVLYTWPALVLIVLLVTGLAESSLLVEFGWVTFVICCMKASQELSWRRALTLQTDESESSANDTS